MTIKELQKLCHKSAVKLGFWSQDILEIGSSKVVGKNYLDRNNGEMIALMHSELSEALEELRKEKINWDKVGEELSDCVIRIMDFCEARGIDLEKEVKTKMIKNKKRKYKHGKRF